MSRFLSSRYAGLKPYVPGEQPRGMQNLVKLNTNESPFAPTPAVVQAAARAAENLQLYSDPSCFALHAKLAECYGVKPCQVLAGNGSDELLFFAFTAFCDANTPVAFPDISYGFYPVFAQLCNIEARPVPLREDFTVDPASYAKAGCTVVIANPNAPTGMALSLGQVAEICRTNSENVVIIDEAYVDFGGSSAVALLDEFPNLLVVRTFSKSRSLAGGRLGFALGSEDLIADLGAVKYSFNPYSVNSMTMAAGIATLEEPQVMQANCQTIIENRAYTVRELERLGFCVLPSSANFVFARHERLGGLEVFEALRARGVLVRHFETGRLAPFNRISIGSLEQMQALVKALEEIVR